MLFGKLFSIIHLVTLIDVDLCQGAEFFRGFRSADQGRLADVWDEIHSPQLPHAQGRDSLTNLPVMDHTVRVNTPLRPDFDGKLKPLPIFLVKFACDCTRSVSSDLASHI